MPPNKEAVLGEGTPRARPRRASWIIATAVILTAATAAAQPTRVISLNLCADQLVLALAEPRNIRSITWLALDCEISVMCAAAARHSVNHGTAEELIASSPDLVVAGRYTARAAVAVARQLGLPVLDLDVPRDLEAVRRQIAEVAAALGETARGEAMLATIAKDLAAVPLPDGAGTHPLAAVYQANGVTVGAGSLIDAILARAGFDNLARKLRIDNYAYLPLEALIAGRPDILVLSSARSQRPSLAGALLRHPALTEAFGPAHRVVIPQRLWICAGPANVEAVRILAERREALREGPQPLPGASDGEPR